MKKIVVAADLHLGRGGKKGIIQYSKTFVEMIDAMIGQGPKYAIFPGDLFHNVASFSPETYNEILLDGFLKLRDAGIEVILLPGNHDFEANGVRHALNPFNRHEGIRVFDTISGINDDDYYMVFIPWLSKVGLKANQVNTNLNAQDLVYEIHEKIVKPAMENHAKYIAMTPRNMKTTICFFHASLIGFSPCATSANIVGTDFLLDPEYIKGCGFAHVIGGHFHRRQEKNGVAYVGSMERNDFGEKDNPTGFMVIEGGDKGWYELKSSQKFMEVEFNLADGFVCPESAEDHFVKVKAVMSRHDVLDRTSIKKQLEAVGALSVEFEPKYTDEIQARTNKIKMELPQVEMLAVWAEENPDKAMDGLVEKVYEFETKAGFPDDNEFEIGKHVEALIASANGG